MTQKQKILILVFLLKYISQNFSSVLIPDDTPRMKKAVNENFGRPKILLHNGKNEPIAELRCLRRIYTHAYQKGVIKKILNFKQIKQLDNQRQTCTNTLHHSYQITDYFE